MIKENGEGGESPLPTYFAVPEGQGQFLPLGEKYVEIDVNRPIAHQLHPIPPGVIIQPLALETMPADARNEFLILTYQSVMSYQMSQNTYGQHGPHWITNSLENYQAFINCKPVDQIPERKKDFALIVGNGPSFHQQIHDIPENAEVFACWRVVKDLVSAGKTIDYACHIDHTSREGWAEELPCPAIAMPQADPKFIRMADKGLYGYFDSAKVCSSWFSGFFGIPSHTHVIGSVAHMMVNAALYAGHKDIVLLGIDHAWEPTNDYDDLNKISRIVTNKHGKTLRTYLGLIASVSGLTTAAKANYEHARIWQASDICLDMQGIDYKALSEWTTCLPV